MDYRHNDFHPLMDKVCTSLFEGEVWHGRSANECRKIAVRGFGRWHDSEAECDMKSRLCLEKLLRDRLGYATSVDTSVAAKPAAYSINGASGLKNHLEAWMRREEEFAETLSEAVRMAATVDICIYKELCCLAEEVQSEAMRVKMCGMRLDMAGWNGHDIGIVSMILHKHFEEHPHDKYVNVNIG